MKRVLMWLSVFGILTAGSTTQISPAKSMQNRKSLEGIVLDNSSKNKVVMFGEKHGTYRADNDFLARLLPELREKGFEYLAIEFEKNPRKNSFHEIIQDYADGRLTRQDMRTMWVGREKRLCAGTFDLIDTAKKLGMKLIFYDADESAYNSWEERERISFDNLKELVFEKDPKGKVVIFCGASHINEKPYEDMSADLQRASQEKIRYLACYIDKDFRGKNFTISLVGSSDSQIIAPHCDMIVDLDENIYYYNFESK